MAAPATILNGTPSLLEPARAGPADHEDLGDTAEIPVIRDEDPAAD